MSSGDSAYVSMINYYFNNNFNTLMRSQALVKRKHSSIAKFSFRMLRPLKEFRFKSYPEIYVRIVEEYSEKRHVHM